MTVAGGPRGGTGRENIGRALDEYSGGTLDDMAFIAGAAFEPTPEKGAALEEAETLSAPGG